MSDQPDIHGRDHRGLDPATNAKGADPARLYIDSTENVGTDQGVRSYGAGSDDALQSDGAGGSFWGPTASGGSFTYADYTPTLTASTSNPTLGSSNLVARWAQSGKLVHYYGQLTTDGGTFDPGVGYWHLSVPAAIPNSVDTPGWTSKPNSCLGIANIYGTSPSGYGSFRAELIDGAGSPLTFLTQDSFPFGNPVRFGAGVGYSFADPGFADIFLWSVVYETSS